MTWKISKELWIGIVIVAIVAILLSIAALLFLYRYHHNKKSTANLQQNPTNLQPYAIPNQENQNQLTDEEFNFLKELFEDENTKLGVYQEGGIKYLKISHLGINEEDKESLKNIFNKISPNFVNNDATFEESNNSIKIAFNGNVSTGADTITLSNTNKTNLLQFLQKNTRDKRINSSNIQINDSSIDWKKRDQEKKEANENKKNEEVRQKQEKENNQKKAISEVFEVIKDPDFKEVHDNLDKLYQEYLRYLNCKIIGDSYSKMEAFDLNIDQFTNQKNTEMQAKELKLMKVLKKSIRTMSNDVSQLWRNSEHEINCNIENIENEIKTAQSEWYKACLNNQEMRKRIDNILNPVDLKAEEVFGIPEIDKISTSNALSTSAILTS